LEDLLFKRQKSLAGENNRTKERASQRESSAISHQSACRLKVPKQPQSTFNPRAIVMATKTMKKNSKQLIRSADDFGYKPIISQKPAINSTQGKKWQLERTGFVPPADSF